ncbi:mechanosensitive ion channel domain-containing protein [Xanthobacteraceae bacterium A53D]
MPRSVLLLLAFFALFSPPALAQTPPAAAPPPTAEATTPDNQNLKALLDTLSDDKARAEFTARLKGLVEASGEAATDAPARDDWIAGATRSLGGVSAGLLTMLSEIEHLPAQISEAAGALRDPVNLKRVAWVAITVILSLSAALAAEWLTVWLLARPRRAVEGRPAGNLLVKLFLITVRAVLLALPIAAFAAAAYAVLAAVEMSFVVRLAVVSLVNASVLARVITAVGRAVLAPEGRHLRLPPLDDESAQYGFLWLWRFTHTIVYGYFIVRAGWILGLSSAAYTFLLNALALLVAGMAVVFLLQIRASVAARLRSSNPGASHLARLRNQMADFWHLLAIAYVVAAYVVWVMDVENGFLFLARATLLSAVTLVAARFASALLTRGGVAIFKLNDEVREQFPLLEARANRYLPILGQVFQGLVVLFAVVVLLEIWGGNPFAWLASANGQHLLSRAISIGIVALVALLAWEVGSAFAERLIRLHPSSTRLKTLLPFLQNAFRIVLLTVVGLIFLSEIGVNIAPLLAGAGVFGLAIGFGAQTLVKDVITGIFILMEDTISVGDVVEVGAHSGLVEKITIRTVHMRDFDGNVHSIPFSEVQTVKNMSKGFAYAVVDVMVSYRENIDEALAVMAEVAEDMRQNGPLADTIIAPFEVVGVEGLQESAIWLRGRFKTRPLGQWNVKREFYRRIKAAFDARGIEIPLPQRRLYFGVDKKGNAPPLHVVNTEPTEAMQQERRSRVEAVRASRTPGPLIEEHPGAREREDNPDEELLPTVERQVERV